MYYILIAFCVFYLSAYRYLSGRSFFRKNIQIYMKKMRNKLFIKAYFELSVNRIFVKKNIVHEPGFIRCG